jgi:hypothetical protein
VNSLQKAFVRKSGLGSMYRTAEGSISFTEIRKASRKSRSSIQHHRIFIATWTENRKNVYRLSRKSTVTEKQERLNESNVNITHEKDLCDDNTPDDTDAFQAEVCSVFGEFGRDGELRCRV